MNLTPEDRQILRNLARQVAEIAALPIQAERRDQWILHNNLRSQRPMILVGRITCGRKPFLHRGTCPVNRMAVKHPVVLSRTFP